MANQKVISKQDEIDLNFALSKANEDLKKYDKAIKLIHKGNLLRKNLSKYSIDESENHNEIIKRLFTENSFKKAIKISYKSSDFRPIFILGMPRSGTSLIEQIISSHPSVYGGGELNDLTKILIPIITLYSNNE